MVNDGAIYRSATLSGRYRCLKIPVAADWLLRGENTVELRIGSGKVMYDTILLKVV